MIMMMIYFTSGWNWRYLKTKYILIVKAFNDHLKGLFKGKFNIV